MSVQFMPSETSSSVHIFDCDGVILDSNSLKLSALRSSLELIDASSSFIGWAVQEFRMNFGRTRTNHFNTFLRYAENNGYNVTKKMILKAMSNYSENVVRLYKDCPIIEETNKYIENLPCNSFIFVVSASDQAELRSVLPDKCPILRSSSIYGGPISKTENIKNVMNITKASSALFYGDSVQDAKAAMNSGIHFFGLTKYSADSEALKIFCKSNDLRCYLDCLQVPVE